MESMAPHESTATAGGDMDQHETARVRESDNQSATNDARSDEVDALPSLEGMEELILEAYNNMQSDGEHIFLPNDVVSKLHHFAHLVKSAGYDCDDIEPVAPSNQAEAASDAAELDPLSDSAVQSATPPSLQATLSSNQEEFPKLSPLHLSSDSASPIDTAHQVMEEDDEIESAKKDSDQRWSRNQENHVEPSAHEVEMEPMPLINEMPQVVHLPTVEEVNEDTLSVSDLQSIQGEPSTPAKPAPRAVATVNMAKKPVSRLRQPEIKHRVSPQPRRSSIFKPSASTKTPPAPSFRPNLHASRIKTDQSALPKDRPPPTTSAFEQKREAAKKQREEKALREQQARELARKQREDARKKIEEAHEKEAAAKRERAAKVKLQKERKNPLSKPSTIR